jgi:hypothetical protein
MKVISDESKLSQLSMACEPPGMILYASPLSLGLIKLFFLISRLNLTEPEVVVMLSLFLMWT